jgi:hypothetical protein
MASPLPATKVIKVDRSAAAQALNEIRRAARKKDGPGLFERLEIEARRLERTGGEIEEDISGESKNILKKAEDFQQSRSGDQMFSSESNSVVVRLQRALWYADVLMRGVNLDKCSSGKMQVNRIKAARTRLEAAIKEAELFGIQRQLVMRATWVLSRFQKWSDKHRKIQREKEIKRIKTIIPDNWLKKIVTRKCVKIEEEKARELQVFEGLRRLEQFKPMKNRTSSSSSSESTFSSSDEEEVKQMVSNDGFKMSKETTNSVDAIISRRAARKKREKDRVCEIQKETKKMMKKMKRERKKKKKKKKQLATMRDVDEITIIQKKVHRKSKSLHKSMAHVVARPSSPEERWEADMYSDYEEYDETVRGNKLGNGKDVAEHGENYENDGEYGDFDGNSHEDDGDNSNENDNVKTTKKHKIFSMDEVLAMHAETDFVEDVATFLDGSGLVKNTGPAARVKFVRMMKVSYLDIRTKKLQRTKRVISVIKKIKDMLRRVLLMPGDDDVLPSLVDSSKKSLEETDPNIDPDDIDALLHARETKSLVGREQDFDIFKRWAGKKVVALEPLLSVGMESRVSAVQNQEDEDDGIYRFKRKGIKEKLIETTWVCKVCMKINKENSLVCKVCGREPNAPATSWGLGKHRPRRTHPRFMHTWNQKTGETIRQWEKKEQEEMERRRQSGRKPTMSEELKERFFMRAREGGVLIP